jgi:hypothetical protein
MPWIRLPFERVTPMDGSPPRVASGTSLGLATSMLSSPFDGTGVVPPAVGK